LDRNDIFSAARSATHIYTGRLACGCLVSHTTDIPGQEKLTHSILEIFKFDRLTIERVPKGIFNAMTFGRNCEKCKIKNLPPDLKDMGKTIELDLKGARQ
jgi:hypothetical protein